MNSLESSGREISGRELIALVRESFAFNDEVFLDSGVSRVPAEILNFEDSDTRDISVERKIEFKLTNYDSKFYNVPDSDVKIEVITKRFKLVLLARAVETIESAITFIMPQSGFIEVLRLSERISVLEGVFHDALVQTEKDMFPCMVKLMDISNGALGARIISEHEISLSLKPSIETFIKTEDMKFEGKATITRLSLIKKTDSNYEYLAALTPAAVSAGFKQITRASRTTLGVTMKCIVVSTNTSVVLELVDVSVTGFRVSKSTPKLPWICEGMLIRETSTQLDFCISRRESDGGFALRLSSEQPEDKIRWSNYILPFVRTGRVAANAQNARGLINVFLEAGGSIADNLAYKRHSVISEKSLNVLTKESQVMLRWVNISDSGTILGHHSSYRVGLNSWFTGDIVGGQASHRKIDRDFISLNFRSFKEIISTFREPQSIFGSWKHGHPYWQKWREFMIERDCLIFNGLYDHIARDDIENCQSNVVFESFKISDLVAGGVRNIEKTVSLIRKSGLAQLLGALDLTANGVFFNGLNGMYDAASMPGFKREAFVIENENIRCLVIYSQLPIGVSVNGVFDTAFVFPMDVEANSASASTIDEKRNLYTAILMHGMRRGIRTLSIRSFLDVDTCVGAKTELVVLTSEGLEFF